MLLAAAFVAAITFCVHTFVGGPIVAGPLIRNQDLPEASKWLSYYCWHIATLVIAALAVALFWLSGTDDDALRRPAVVFFATLISGLAGLSVVIALVGSINPLRFPSTTLFFVTACLCWADVLNLHP